MRELASAIESLVNEPLDAVDDALLEGDLIQPRRAIDRLISGREMMPA